MSACTGFGFAMTHSHTAWTWLTRCMRLYAWVVGALKSRDGYLRMRAFTRMSSSKFTHARTSSCFENHCSVNPCPARLVVRCWFA
jgi:hypothetical protein